MTAHTTAVRLSMAHYGFVPAATSPAGGPLAGLAPWNVRTFVLELRASMSPVRRQGRWTVPRRLVVRNTMSNIKLDFTKASIPHPIVEIDVDVSFGKTFMVLPAGATANTDGIELTGSKIRRSGIELEPQPGSGPHIVLTGTQRFGKLVIRRQRRFLRWRW